MDMYQLLHKKHFLLKIYYSSSYGGRLIVNEQIALTDDPVIVEATAVSDFPTN